MAHKTLVNSAVKNAWTLPRKNAQLSFDIMYRFFLFMSSVLVKTACTHWPAMGQIFLLWLLRVHVPVVYASACLPRVKRAMHACAGLAYSSSHWCACGVWSSHWVLLLGVWVLKRTDGRLAKKNLFRHVLREQQGSAPHSSTTRAKKQTHVSRKVRIFPARVRP